MIASRPQRKQTPGRSALLPGRSCRLGCRCGETVTISRRVIALRDAYRARHAATPRKPHGPASKRGHALARLILSLEADCCTCAWPKCRASRDDFATAWCWYYVSIKGARCFKFSCCIYGHDDNIVGRGRMAPHTRFQPASYFTPISVDSASEDDTTRVYASSLALPRHAGSLIAPAGLMRLAWRRRHFSRASMPSACRYADAITRHPAWRLMKARHSRGFDA